MKLTARIFLVITVAMLAGAGTLARALGDGRVIVRVHQAKVEKERNDDSWGAAQDFYVLYAIDGAPPRTAPEVRNEDDATWADATNFKLVPGRNQRFFDLYFELWDNDTCCNGNIPDDFDISPQNGVPPKLPSIYDPNYPNGGFPHVEYDVCTGELVVKANGGTSTPIRVGSGAAVLDGHGTTSGTPNNWSKLKISVEREPANWLPEDIQLSRAQIVQAVYDATQAVVLKPTALVVDVDSTYPLDLVAPLHGELSDGNTTVTDDRLVTIHPGHNRYYLFDGAGSPPFLPFKPFGGNLAYVTGLASLDYHEPISPLAPPQIMDCANLNNTAQATALPLRWTDDPKVVYRRFDYTEDLDFVSQPDLVEMFDREEAFRAAAWPISQTHSSINKVPLDFDHGATFPFFEPATSMLLGNKLASVAGIDRLVMAVRRGWFPDNGFRHQFVDPNSIGLSYGTIKPRAIIAEVGPRAVVSHELGHTFGQSIHHCSNGGSLEALWGFGCFDEYLFAPGDTAPFEALGFDVEGRIYPNGYWEDPNTTALTDCPARDGNKDICAYNHMDVNGTNGFINWLDAATFDSLFDKLHTGTDPIVIVFSAVLRMPIGLPPPPPPPPPIIGELDQFNFIYAGVEDLPQAPLTPNGEVSSGRGPFALQLRTPAGVRRYRFSARFMQSDITPEMVAPISLSIPWDPQTFAVELVGPNDPFIDCTTGFCPQSEHVLFAMPRTPLPPGVANLRAGLDVLGPLKPYPQPWVIGPGHAAALGWDAADPDSGQLRTMLLVGKVDAAGQPAGPQVPMAAQLDGGTYSIPHDSLSDDPGTYVVRVLVTDGINTTEITSGPLFTICNFTNGGVEACNGIDDDCDGFTDNAVIPDGSGFVSLNPHPLPPGIDWSPVPGAETYDLVVGDLSALRANGLTGAVLGCLANDIPGTSFPTPVPLQPGQGVWFLARPANCAGPGSFNTAGGSQAGPRDAAIAASPASCPQ